MDRKRGLQLLKQNVQNQNLIKHCLAVEAVMTSLAERFGQDKEKWGLAGLLHDIDYEMTKDKPEEHSLTGAKMLEDFGVEAEICQAVRTHNEIHKIPLRGLIEKALFVSDPVTGLIVASALVLPSKKLADLQTESVLNRFKEKSFARGANREIIRQCQPLLGLELPEFMQTALMAMQKIAGDLGL